MPPVQQYEQRCRYCKRTVWYDSLGMVWYDRTDATGCPHAPWRGFNHLRMHEVEQ